MKEKYTPGEGCLCHAHSEAECGCDVDWTPREVYELREQRARLLAEREQWRMSSVCRELSKQRDRLMEAMETMWPFIVEDDQPNCNTPAFSIAIAKYKAAIAAVKGGSDD